MTTRLCLHCQAPVPSSYEGNPMVYPYILRHTTLPTGYVFLYFCDKCALRFGAELLKWLQAGRDEDRFIETRRTSVCDRCENVFVRPVDAPNIQLDSTEEDTVRRGLWMAYELCPDCVNEAERMIDGFIKTPERTA